VIDRNLPYRFLRGQPLKCSAFDMEMIFHSYANKTHFHKKGCVPHFESEGFWNAEVAYLQNLNFESHQFS